MPPATPAPRTAADRCPGVLRLIAAADGYLARVRLPGGLVEASGLHTLATAARELGDGTLELTSRGNVQLRGLAAEAATELGNRLAAAGLWPSQTHERVRNIVASPLGDLAPAVRALDAALCADPRLAELSGRFLFGFDDGDGHIAALAPDVLAVGDVVEQLAVRDVTGAMLAAAHAFLDERAAQHSSAWRVDDLDGGRAGLRARLGARLGSTASTASAAGGVVDASSFDGTPTASPLPPAGAVAGGHVLLVPLGRLSADQADWLAERTGTATAKITPWRSVLVPTSDVTGAAEAGFGLDAASRWYGISACAGQPGCEKAFADVQSEAARTAAQWHERGLPVHFSGCGRRCGRPAGTVFDVVATENGYVTSSA